MSAICGIVGEGAAKGRGRRDVSLMLELLKPRGPDGAALHDEPEASRPVALGVRQLAVGRLPAQPVMGPFGDPATVVAYDGEIFNHADVRKRILDAGRTLRGDD